MMWGRMEMKEKQLLQVMLSARGYELCDKAGEGATSQVYKIYEQASGQYFACKVSEKTEWLSPESELLKSLRHPLFPEWKDYWEEAGSGFLVMEFISGSSLEKCLDKIGKFTRKEALRVALALADGLGYLHERKTAVVYRDLKPENVILQPDGKVRLTDLGAAAVPCGWKAGTLGYAAPEMKLSGENTEERGKPVPASDIYSLGVVMHQMLTGCPPCKEGQELFPIRKYDQRISPGVEDIIWRCTRPCPEERIQGMRELMRELGAYYNRSKLQMARKEWKAMGKRKQRIVYEKNVWESDYGNDL